MSRITDIEESRRQFLLHLLATGALATLPSGLVTAAPLPGRLPPGRAIHRLFGDVYVNDKTATIDTMIKPGDTVTTGKRSFVIFVVQKDAFILRSNSTMTLPGRKVAAGKITTAYALKRGKVLSVLASRRTNISTPNAMIGVRGTGVYVETEPEQSYVCVCYGTSDVAAADDPTTMETIVSDHHTAPKYILSDPNASKRIVEAPFKNHDDQELLLIETLVGRTTPYVVPAGVPRTRSNYF